MKITFLGTSAATSCPLPFCRCPVCTQARQLGGPDLRKRSSLLVNEDLLIDLGPDIMAASFMHGFSIEGVRYWLQTHSHADHFDVTHLITRIPEYGVVDLPPLCLYASMSCLESMSAMLNREWPGTTLFDAKHRERLNLDVCPLEHFETRLVGSYRVTAFPSNHDQVDDSLLYVIQDNQHTLFYGVDTPVLSDDTWKGFHDKQLQFDIVILDHTYGENVGGVDHLNATQFIEHVKRLRDEKVLAEGARIFATHISHEGNPNHADLVAWGKRHGYEIAYDGLDIDLKSTR